MYPRLRDDVSIGTVTCKDSPEKHYYVENKKADRFKVSYRVYKELVEADGTHPLRISKSLLKRMKKEKILTTKRYVFEGIISRFVLIPFGKSITKFRPVFRILNAVLPFLAVFLLSVSILLKQKNNHSSISDVNVFL